MAAVAVFQNASLEFLNLTNTNDAALDTRTFVAFHKATGKQGGMVDMADAAAGAVAGIIEEYGFTSGDSALTSVSNIPVGQSARVRRRGITFARAGAVSILPGELVYAIPASGKVTNSSAGNTIVGVALSETTGTDDQLVVIDICRL